jgi:TIR domain
VSSNSDPLELPPRQLVGRLLQLLQVDSFDVLVRSLLDRMLLGGSRFEAHEFGRDQHSSASAAAILTGFAHVSAIPDSTIAPIAVAVGSLVNADGSVRGHDEGPGSFTTWSGAQLLLSLLVRPHLAVTGESRLPALVDRVVGAQKSTGGWSLRADDNARLLFTFYPCVALLRADRVGIGNRPAARGALTRAATYLATGVRLNEGVVEEQVLALRVLQLIDHALPGSVQADQRLLREEVNDRLADRDSGGFVDQTVVVYPQPTWHATIWRPLLYLAYPGTSPLGVPKVLLGQELVSAFDPDIAAWRGPSDGVGPGAGTSWASALALWASYRLARDLVRHDCSVAEWRDRCREISSPMYEFDVVISFAGADRALAAEIAEVIKRAGYRVFYDRDHQHALLGEDLAAYLQDTYLRRSRFAVALISGAFLKSRWAGNWEWKAVLARMQQTDSSYLLPYFVEAVQVPGLNPTLGYVSGDDYTPAEFARLVARKLRGIDRKL